MAKDVAKALGYSNSNKAEIDHCEAPQMLKGNESLPLSKSPHGILIISKPDVYRLVTHSKLPQAERFEVWLFEEIRTIKKADGSYWFVAGDAAKALGYKYPKDAVKVHCEAPETLKGVDSTTLTKSPYGIKIISKPDVFRLVTHSKLPQAKRFEKWLFEEVLPQIEEAGSYTMPVTIE